jgi:F0F1-type ATP synthase delta subunit
MRIARDERSRDDLQRFMAFAASDLSLLQTVGSMSKQDRISVMKTICDSLGISCIIREFFLYFVQKHFFTQIVRVVQNALEILEFSDHHILTVFTAKELLECEKKEMSQVMRSRCSDEMENINVVFCIIPSLIGGIMIKLGEQMFDFSINSIIRRI